MDVFAGRKVVVHRVAVEEGEANWNRYLSVAGMAITTAVVLLFLNVHSQSISDIERAAGATFHVVSLGGN